MDPLKTVKIGKTEVAVTRLGLGGAPLGGLFSDVSQDDAVATIHRALDLGVRLLDTAPQYGLGKSERYFGQALEDIPRSSFVLSTKVGRVLEAAERPPDLPQFANLPSVDFRWDFSRDGVLKALEDSLERLRLDHTDIVLIHDADEQEENLPRVLSEAMPALVDLRAQGVVKAIGMGMDNWEPLMRLAEEGDFDCFLVAGRYTLLDQSAGPELFPLCEKKGISIILGGPYNSGVLASDLSPDATYFYERVPAEVLERARGIKSVCDRHGVPLKAAALQFGLAHPVVAATIPGARSMSEVEENLEMARHSIPGALWAELRQEGFVPDYAPTP